MKINKIAIAVTAVLLMVGCSDVSAPSQSTGNDHSM